MNLFPDTVASYLAKVQDPKTRKPCERTIRARVKDGTIAAIREGALLKLETPESTQRRAARLQGVPLPEPADQPESLPINACDDRREPVAGRSVSKTREAPVEPALA
jgi:hypothetical protein